LIAVTKIPRRADVVGELCRRNLSDFIKHAWHIIEPATEYRHNWHIELLCEHLAQVPEQTRRLIINVPPRQMKSILVSVMWPCWLWLRQPSLRMVFCSYSDGLSTKHSVDRRTIIESEWYQRIWRGVKLAGTTKAEVHNTARGVMTATSVGGTLTGKGGDIIVIDDPMDPKRALSNAERESANRWIDLTLTTRLNNPKTGAIVLIMQRLHTDDTTGHLLQRGEWEHVVVPSPASEDTEYRFPVSGRVVKRVAGQPMWPEREDVDDLEAKRRSMGRWGFSGQYEQRPSPLGGGIIKRDWFKYYDRLDIDMVPRIVQSWDMTFKQEGTSYVCGQVWGADGPKRYLLDRVRRRMGFVETTQAVLDAVKRWPRTQCVLVEDKANGPAVIDMLRSRIPILVPYNPKGDKVERAQAASPQIEAGNVYLPAAAPWVEEFLHEVTNFPRSEHDDQVDAMAQALLYLWAGGALTGNAFSGTFLEKGVSATLDW